VETFVVRLWTPAPELGEDGDALVLRGLVDHPRSGGSTPFERDDELVRLLRACLGSHHSSPEYGRKESSCFGV
jgi:hypothetical protein